MITNDNRVFADTIKAAYGGAWPTVHSKVAEDHGSTMLVDVTIVPVDSGDTGLSITVPVTFEDVVYQLAATTDIDLDALTEQQLDDLVLKHSMRPIDLFIGLLKRYERLPAGAQAYLQRRFGVYLPTMRRMAKERE